MIRGIRSAVSGLVAAACRLLLMIACGLIALGSLFLSLRFPVIRLLVVCFAAWRRHSQGTVSDSYGWAATASLSQMESGGLLCEDGLILGCSLADPPSLAAGVSGLFSPWNRSGFACRTFFASVFGGKWLSNRLIRVNNYVHLLTCSPAGGGKGIAALIPNLLSYRGNCVVVDPKGELFRATARHRHRKFGHRIIRLDPFGVCGPGGDSLNPFDFIDHRADDFVDECRDLGDMLVIRQHDEKDPHWNESACNNITALSCFVCGAEPDRSKRHLGTVRAIAASRNKYALAVEIMQQTESCQGVIAMLGGSLTWHEGEELASVQSTLARHTNFLDSPAVRRNTSSSSFDPMILRQGKADVFLILPHDRLSSLSRLQRLWIGTIMRRITSGVPTEKSPVLWLLDEMAHIGHMQAIEDAVTLYRGMGIRLWFIFQSLNQVKTCFGEKASTVLDSIGTQQFFAINSYETAEEISKRIGDATIAIETENYSWGHSHNTGVTAQQESRNRSTNNTLNRSEIARRLLKPEEVLTLSPDICLIFHKHVPVTVGRLVKFFEAPEFKRGGTAAPRRLGVAATVLAIFTLLASCLVTGAALIAAGPQAWPLPPVVAAAGRQSRNSVSSRAQAATVSGSSRIVPDFRRASRPGAGSRRRTSGCDYLIKIE
jgi:type IV secretion system protein VirD4